MSEEVEEVDVCPVCQEIFLEMASLRSHMKEVHLKKGGGKSEADESRSGRRPTVVANLERKQRSLAEYSAGKQEKFTEVSIFDSDVIVMELKEKAPFSPDRQFLSSSALSAFGH